MASRFILYDKAVRDARLKYLLLKIPTACKDRSRSSFGNAACKNQLGIRLTIGMIHGNCLISGVRLAMALIVIFQSEAISGSSNRFIE